MCKNLNHQSFFHPYSPPSFSHSLCLLWMNVTPRGRFRSETEGLDRACPRFKKCWNIIKSFNIYLHVHLSWLVVFLFFFHFDFFFLFLKKVVPTSNEVSFCGSHLKPLRVRFMISQTFKTILTRTHKHAHKGNTTHTLKVTKATRTKGEKGTHRLWILLSSKTAWLLSLCCHAHLDRKHTSLYKVGRTGVGLCYIHLAQQDGENKT